MFKKGESTNHVQKARIRRTKYFFENRNAFMLDLAHDITNAYKLARKHNLTPVIRLNGTSDLSWEKYIVPGFNRTLFEVFNYIQFYDYTKVLGRKVKHIPNYHLTFSRAENNEADCDEARRQGMNVATVYDTIPAGVYSAENDDLRFLDPQVGTIGLKAKGPAKKDYSGFVIRINQVA
jgi:SPX domain protein involved in polyphosphate accumulation